MLAEKLEKYRIERKMKKGDFAEFIGSNPYTYSHIISGRREASDEFLTKLELATELPKEYWISSEIQEAENYNNENYIKDKKEGSAILDTIKLLMNNKTIVEPEDVKNKEYLKEILLDAIMVDIQHLKELQAKDNDNNNIDDIDNIDNE